MSECTACVGPCTLVAAAGSAVLHIELCVLLLVHCALHTTLNHSRSCLPVWLFVCLHSAPATL